MCISSSSDHDSLRYRLTHILRILDDSKWLDSQELAQEFNVNLRTIQNNPNDRSAFLPIGKTIGHYFLLPTFLGKLSLHDVEQFACMASVPGLFPALSNDFPQNLCDSHFPSALTVKGTSMKTCADKELVFRWLEQAFGGAVVAHSPNKPEEVNRIRRVFDAHPVNTHFTVQPIES